jgi:TPR repeat protein
VNHLWKVALLVVLAVVTLGAIVAWNRYKAKEDARKLAEDVQTTRDRALKGDSDAEQKLAAMYYYGHGVPQDYSQALEWYRKAADQGNPQAEYGIGYMYDTGKGVQQDFAKASRWFEQAVDKGDRQAECGLAAMYFKGRGVPQDRAKAALLCRRSADQGFARAEYDLGYMYYYGQGIPQDRTEARLWFRRAAEHGDERAKSLLGLKLKAWLVPFLVIQAMAGIALAFRPLSLNMWEPNEGVHDYRDGLSVGTGALFLLTAGLSWYGYTHNLIWCWVYGVTGFQLIKWSLDAVALALLYFVFFPKKTLETEEPTEAL